MTQDKDQECELRLYPPVKHYSAPGNQSDVTIVHFPPDHVFAVVATDYHGGQVLATCATADEAYAEGDRLTAHLLSECSCGCYGLLDRNHGRLIHGSDLIKPVDDYQAGDPYSDPETDVISETLEQPEWAIPYDPQ